MKNFVIRVYRQNAEDQNQVVGVVEHIEEDKQSSFSTMDELIQILCKQKPIGEQQIDEADVRNAINSNSASDKGPEWGDVKFENDSGPSKGEKGEREN
jgi:hypothetical protein